MIRIEEFPYSIHELSNGIRLVHRHSTSPVAHCGITIDVGSRDELHSENGMVHFIEHCIFKGTEKRKAFHILNRIDGVGGELNAFTTKEETCIYATFLNSYHERFLELLADIVFHSVFPDRELDKEKVVILDEINSYEDSPYELIADEFEHLLFGNHGLGRLILGTPERINSFTSAKVKEFISRNYSTESMVISVVSSIEADKWFSLCEKYFARQEKMSSRHKRYPPRNCVPRVRVEERDTFQSHLMIGTKAYGYKSEKKLAFSLLNNILGGPAMNSYLNMHIREKYGFAYTIESMYTAYSDCGVFSIYAGTDKKYAERTIRLIMDELDRFTQEKISDGTLLKYKKQMMGQLAINMDSNQNDMLSAAKALLNFGKVDSLQTVYDSIERLTAEDLLICAREIFAPEKLSRMQYV